MGWIAEGSSGESDWLERISIGIACLLDVLCNRNIPSLLRLYPATTTDTPSTPPHRVIAGQHTWNCVRNSQQPIRVDSFTGLRVWTSLGHTALN